MTSEVDNLDLMIPLDSDTSITPHCAAHETALDISATSEDFDGRRCVWHDRCGLSGCVHCDEGRGQRRVPEIVHNLRTKGQCLYHLILTLKPVDDASNALPLGELLDQLCGGFKKLREHLFWVEHVKGGMYRLDVPFPGHWHPHLHCIIEASPLNKSQIVAAWKKVSGGSYIVGLRKATDSDRDRWKLTSYVMKAPQKSIAHNPVLLAEYRKAMRGRRKADRFGTWRNTAKSPDRWRKLQPAPHPEAERHDHHEPKQKQREEWAVEAALILGTTNNAKLQRGSGKGRWISARTACHTCTSRRAHGYGCQCRNWRRPDQHRG